MKPIFKIYDRVWIDDGCRFGQIVGRADIVDVKARVWHFEYFVQIGGDAPVWMHECDLESVKK